MMGYDGGVIVWWLLLLLLLLLLFFLLSRVVAFVQDHEERNVEASRNMREISFRSSHSHVVPFHILYIKFGVPPGYWGRGCFLPWKCTRPVCLCVSQVQLQ